MNIKIAIASNARHARSTISVIIPSLLNAGVSPEDIYTFIGGYGLSGNIVKGGSSFYFLDHNSFDFGPLIAITEERLYCADYWFLIHDTCRVGPNFLHLMNNFSGNPEKIALKKFPSMNIGLYSCAFVREHATKILALKNNDNTEEGLKKYKSFAIENEDLLLHRVGGDASLYNNGDIWFVADHSNWYGTETNRRTEYYVGLDLYKSKGNWDGKVSTVSL